MDNASDLIQVVMRSVFYDISSLSIEDIKELLMRIQDLTSLKTALQVIASRLPAVDNPERRSQLIREADMDVILEWQTEYPSRVDEISKWFEMSDKVYDIVEAFLTLSFGTAIKSVKFGFKLASRDKDRDHTKNKYRFLNRLEHKARTTTSSLTLPAFGKLASE